MADYSVSSDILSGAAANIQALFTSLEDEIPVEHGTQLESTSASTSSATPVILDTLTLTLESDEFASVSFQAEISAGTANAVAEFKWRIDGTSYEPQIFWEGVTASTASDKGGIVMQFEIGSQSGSIDFEAQWRRTGGSGTLYADEMRFFYKIYKRRS
jgi:hypothetical protein